MAVVGGMVAEEQFDFGSLLHDDQHAAVDHQVDIRAQDIDDLNRTVYFGVFGDIHHESVLGQHGVQGRGSIAVGFRQPCIILPDELGMLGGIGA